MTLVLVGQGPEKEDLQRKAAELGLGNAVFLPPVPRPSMPSLLSSMDALYLGLRRQPLFRFGVSPNKLMDYLAAAKPVIFAVEAGNDPVAAAGCGISCPPEDPGAVATAVQDLLARPATELEAMGRRGRDYVRRHHDYAVLARRFLDIMS